MEVLGFELKKRTGDSYYRNYSGVPAYLVHSDIVFSSIKRNWKGLKKHYYKWKFSPRKILKLLEKNEILEAVRFIHILEGAKDEDLVHLDYQLGNKTLDELIEWAEPNKKKVETVSNIFNQ